MKGTDRMDNFNLSDVVNSRDVATDFMRELVERLRDLSGQAEVIFALSGSVEGETTAFYIYRQIEGLGVRVSTLARGLSFGADLEYADSLTLGRSIIDRQAFKP